MYEYCGRPIIALLYFQALYVIAREVDLRFRISGLAGGWGLRHPPGVFSFPSFFSFSFPSPKEPRRRKPILSPLPSHFSSTLFSFSFPSDRALPSTKLSWSFTVYMYVCIFEMF